MASLPKPVDSKKGGKATVLLGSQWGDEGKGMSSHHTSRSARGFVLLTFVHFYFRNVYFLQESWPMC